MVAFVDRLDQVCETDETNNYAFSDLVAFNQAAPPPGQPQMSSGSWPDLRITSATFSPTWPTQVAPGSAINFWTRITNQGTAPSGSFWLEFWGSKLGGLTLDRFVAESAFVPGISPGASVELTLARSLYSIPDGDYTIAVVADRPDQVFESDEGNNRLPIAGNRLLTVRPATTANLIVEKFTFGSPLTPLRPGQEVRPTGKVRNVGYQSSGPFWIEFWGSSDQDYPRPAFYLCDSIFVPNLLPGGSLDLSAYPRTIAGSVPGGNCAIICFADYADLVNETTDADNYAVLYGYLIVR